MFIFAPEIALRVERSDPARNSYFTAHFSNARFIRALRDCENMKPSVIWERPGERRLDVAQTISLNCGVTHSPGKIEYHCRYFQMTFCT
jgi:hypothetical protein